MPEPDGLLGAATGVELLGEYWGTQMILGIKGLRDSGQWWQWYWDDAEMQNKDMLT